MTREEYAALNKELMRDKIRLEEQLKRVETQIKNLEKSPDKIEELKKLKNEENAIRKGLTSVKEKMAKNYENKRNAENAIRKELTSVKEKMTKNYENKKSAENKKNAENESLLVKAKDKVIKKLPSMDDVKRMTAAGITVIGLGQDLKEILKPDLSNIPKNEQLIIQNKGEQKTRSELVFDKMEKLKGDFEKLNDAREKEKEEKLNQLLKESKAASKTTEKETNNDTEKKQEDLERQKRIEMFMQNKEMTKNKTL
ncbi:MAG: hypothetical protein JNL51_16220 [Chitinophagaceae bacterium]|nr:hypothetical protein [Chitinophagaceae bacterium]